VPIAKVEAQPASPTEVVEAMNAEALALAEPAEGSAGARHIARRILAVTVLGFAMLIVLGGRSRADVLEPAQVAAGTNVNTVGQVVQTATGTATEAVSTAVDAASENVPPIVEAATDAVAPVVGAVTDTLDPVADRLGPVREAAETVPPSTRGILPGDPSNPLPQPPIPGVTPPNPGIPPASSGGPSRASAGSVAGSTGMGSSVAASMPSTIAHPAANTEGGPSSGASHGHGPGPLPFGPFGRGVADGPLTLLVLFAAMAASMTVRPPAIRALLASRIVAPNGAALALSVERPG